MTIIIKRVYKEKMKDISHLEPNIDELSQIELALNQAMPLSDYQSLIIKKLEILYQLKKHQQAITEAMPYVKQKEFQQPLKSDEKLYHLIFKHALALNSMDLSYKMIQKRKEVLLVESRYLAMEDELLLLETYGKPTETILLELIETVILDHKKRLYLEKLLKLYLEKEAHDKLITLYERLGNIDTNKNLFGLYLYALLELKEEDKAQALALKYLDHPSVKKDAYHILITLYIKHNEKHKLMVLETEYEDYIETQEDSFKLEVYEKLLTYYQISGNKPSITLYDGKVKKLRRTLKKEKTELKQTLEEPLPEIIHKTPILTKQEKKTHFLSQLEAIHELITFSHQINEQKVLRDYLRTFFMKLDTHLDALEYIVYLKEEKELFQYKKERLYDKKIIDSWLYETVFEHVLTTNEEVISKTIDLKLNKNLLTQKPYGEDIKHIYCFPIENIGAFGIHLNKELIDPSEYYDLLKAVSSILYAHTIDEKNHSKLRNENIFLNKIIDAPLIAYRVITDKMTHYNTKAQKLLNIEAHLPIELFLIDMEYHQVNPYKNVLKELMLKPNLSKELTYLYQNRQIREKLYSIYDQSEIKIVSIFEDLTQSQAEKNKLLEEATVDFDTRVLNLNALNRHMDQYLEDKGSFLLIELSGDQKTIYGYEETLKFYLEFAQLTKKYFNDGMTYRYDDKQWLVYIPQNDIRTCSKIIKDYLKHLEDYLPQSLKYEQYHVVMSALRYPVSTADKNKFHIYRYLEIALDKAKRQKNNHLFFEYQMYEEEVFEQQVIDYLNVALEHKQFELSFNQIIDIEKNTIWQYESEILLSNTSISNKYLYQIAKKRNRLFELEKYHIKLVCEFLKNLERKTNKLIKLTIPITKESFLNPTFNAYLLGVFKAYDIPTEFIRIKCIAEEIKETHKGRIKELIDHSISLDATSLDVVLTHDFNALHMTHKKSDLKWMHYIKAISKTLNELNIAFVIRDVKTKADRDELKNIGIKFVEGSVYKKIDSHDLMSKIKEVAYEGL